MRWLGAVLLLALFAAAPVQARAAADDAPRILMMLRLAPAHFRAGSGYGGGYGEDQSAAARRRIAAAVARRNGLRLAGNWPMPIIGIDCFILTVPRGRAPAEAAAQVARDPAVEWSEPIETFEAQGDPTPNDPLYPAQPAAHAWHLAMLHRTATGRRARIAVIDSQVDARHPDLAGQVAVERNFVDGAGAAAERHGTGIAGVIAARPDNGVGIVGIAPGARLLALRACAEQGAGAGAATLCDSLSLARAVSFAVEQRADVINLSLAGPPSRLLETLLRIGVARGATVVAAYDPKLPGGGFPASMPGVIAVAESAVGQAGGPYAAPGRDIPTTQPGGRWYLASGSSYAAAEVSGLIALIREEHVPGRRPALVSARPGGGEIDACASVVGKAKCAGLRR
ncbi:serine protease [Sphingomonas sp. ABOLE]|uniref:S8 family peptidase n=1 Tax=Sphingomonas sp. ABOLE TaxID=1985878 RepID=UPI000F7E8847|nr:S8 family serine peptidase [Sphingomonas sp. ABOLE]RSV39629.1 serine protease [Sphingomonas sp. ABOLE]